MKILYLDLMPVSDKNLFHGASTCAIKPTVADESNTNSKYAAVNALIDNQVDNMNSTSANFFCGENFVIDLGCPARITAVHLRNSQHDNGARFGYLFYLVHFVRCRWSINIFRGIRSFNVKVSDTNTGHRTEFASGNMEDPGGYGDGGLK